MMDQVNVDAEHGPFRDDATKLPGLRPVSEWLL